MTRFMKVLGIVGASSAYLFAAGACEMTGDGWSFLPYIGSIFTGFLRGIGT